MSPAEAPSRTPASRIATWRSLAGSEVTRRLRRTDRPRGLQVRRAAGPSTAPGQGSPSEHPTKSARRCTRQRRIHMLRAPSRSDVEPRATASGRRSARRLDPRGSDRSPSRRARARDCSGQLDRSPQVLDRVGGTAGQALAAGDVVEDTGYCGWASIRAWPRSAASAYWPLVQRVERRPHLPAERPYALPRASDREDRRPGLLCEGRALDSFPTKTNVPTGPRTLPVELESRTAPSTR